MTSTDRIEQVRASAFALKGWLRLVPWVIPRRKTLLIQPAPAAGQHQASRLLVLLHGCRQNADEFAVAAGVHQFVAEHGWAVLMLDQARGANLYRCWNWFDKRVLRGGGEVAIVVKATNKVAQRLNIEPSDTAIAGMSSGAALAAAVCAHHPRRFAVALFHSGLPYGASSKPSAAMKAIQNGPQRDVTTLVAATDNSYAAMVVHGTDDDVVNPVHADELIRQALAQSGQLPAGEALNAPDGSIERTSEGRRVTQRRWGRHRQMLIQGLTHAWISTHAGEAPFFSSTGPDTLALLKEHFDETARAGRR